MSVNLGANSQSFEVTTPSDCEIRTTATVLYPSKDVRDMVVQSGMARGAGISYDRLEDLVAELQRR